MKFQEKNPSNARIFIDYRGGKKVRFEYPAKKSPFNICFNSFFTLWMIINLLFFCLFVFVFYALKIFSTSLTAVIIPWKEIFIVFFVLIHLIFTPLVYALIFSKNDKLLSFMPEINKRLSVIFGGTLYYKKITKINSKIFKIPIFSNVFLDYKATEDFAKYLYKVEIKEYDFKVMKKNIFTQKTKIINQDESWYTHFYFSEIPKRGQLEIWFL